MRAKIDTNHSQLKRELMQMSFSHLYFSSASVFVSVIVVIIAFWDISSKTVLVTWLFLLTLILVMRNVQAKRFLNNPLVLSLETAEKKFTFYAIVTAVILSGGIFIILPDGEPFYQAFLTMVSAGLSTGAVMSLSAYKNLVRNYLIVFLLPLIYILYMQDSQLHTLMSILVAIFLAVSIVFSKKYHDNIVNAITSRLQFEEAKKEIKLSKDRFGAVFEQAPVGLFIYDTDLIILEANEAFASLLKAPLKELIGLDMKQLPDQSVRPSLDIVFREEKGHYEGKYHTKISDEDMWISMITMPMNDIDNRIQGGLAIVTDITQRVKAEEAIRYQAFYDHLTGLANRLTFKDRLEHQLARLARHKRLGAVIFIDVDYFKEINDSFGHHIGDEVLKIFASRISSVVRKEDTVARLGGDEFIILLADLSDNTAESMQLALKISEKAHSIMKKAFKIEEHSLNITLSLGVALIGNKDETVDDILKHADIAMYKAKAAGRNCTGIYE